jgi:hypothetical protein
MLMKRISKLKSLRILRLRPRGWLTDTHNPRVLELAKQISASNDTLEELSWGQYIGSFDKAVRRWRVNGQSKTCSPWLASLSSRRLEPHVPVWMLVLRLRGDKAALASLRTVQSSKNALSSNSLQTETIHLQ